MSIPKKPIAIIGGGPGGLCAALFLNSLSIPCEVFEARDADFMIGGPVLMTPNSLRLLDKLGIYTKLQSLGFNFEAIAIRSKDNKIEDMYFYAHKKTHGYKALRIRRRHLVDTLRAFAAERSIPIHYNKKFIRLVSESTSEGAKIEFSDNQVVNASFLIGADGIHSKIRQYVAPGHEPVFGGAVALAALVDASSLRLPKEGFVDGSYFLPTTIKGKHGVYVLLPQSPTGSEVMMFTQLFNQPSQSREEWEAFNADKAKIKSIMTAHDDWPDPVRSGLENMDWETGFIWAYHDLPNLPRWVSTGGLVAIIGDAAHAINPASGQGVNQAIEDAYTLSFLLDYGRQDTGKLASALKHWQEIRQQRIAQVQELARQQNAKRRPEAEREPVTKKQIANGDAHGPVGERLGLHWLLAPDLHQEMQQWIELQKV